ncbi:uncharacterized protein [Montipora capricornis]|uniref:uncharacterized protein isoform X1 n=1 Tax=Montipora capricornis TaxID=246305 RepID=UPI0035F1518D
MMGLFNSFAVLFKIIQVILVLKMTITVNNGAVRVIQTERVSSKTICQGDTFHFECANSSLAMVIYSAWYGRKSGGDTLCPFNAADADPSVLRANDTNDNFVKCTYQNVTLDTMRLCEHRRRCVVTAKETYFGNPCKGVYKYLKIIYACVEKHNFNFTSPTPGTGKKPKTARVTPTRRITLTKRKRTRTANNTFRKSTARTTKAPKVTKRTSSPTSPKLRTESPATVKSTTPTEDTVVSRQCTSKKPCMKTTIKPNAVSKVVGTAKLNITVLTSEVSGPITVPIVYTNSTQVTPKRHKVIQTPTTSTGLVITIQENGNNDTNSTEPAATTPIPVTKGELNGPGSGSSRGPISGEVSSDSPVVMAHESQPAVMGVAGSLYLWFLHMKENKSAYITVFILSALGAALVMLGVVAFFLTAGKKKEFIKLDVIHRPKRFIALPKEKKKINQYSQVEVKEGKETYQTDVSMNRKGPEVVFTSHDVNNQVKKEFNIDRFSGAENGTVHKGDPASIHVNPSFNSGKNNNKPSIIITDQPQFTSPANDAVSSLPSTPARSHTSTDPPEMPTDSSDDDLFSIVAKGTYSSAVPDTYMRHTSAAASTMKDAKNKNKHVYVVVPSGDGSTAV